MISVVISRDGTDLTIGDAYTASGMWLPEDGLGRPDKGWRRSYADEGLYHGNLLVAATLEQATLPIKVYCHAATTAALEAFQEELEDAVSQFTYTATVTIDGSAKVWNCDPADVVWGGVDSGEVRGHLVQAAVTIPVYPIAGT